MDTDQKFECAGCLTEKPRVEFHEFKTANRRKTIASRCKSCRREDYYRTKYPTVCVACQNHRPVSTQDGICRGCHEASGLRECKFCTKLQPALFSFYGRSRRCHSCQRTKPSEPSQAQPE